MFCAQCGQQIANDSRFCSHCGAPQSSRALTGAPAGDATPSIHEKAGSTDERMSLPKVLGIVAACVLGIVAIGNLAGGTDASGNSAGAQAEIGNEATPVAGETRPSPSPSPASAWTYRTSEDKVRGTTSYFAETVSTNEIQQASPYNGGTTMAVTLRYRKGDGTDIVLQISEGQLMCSSYDGCDALVRFDDKPARRVQLVGASDNSSEVAFVSSEKPFLASLRKAKRMTIEKTIYQGGSPQWEFDVSGLRWNH